MGTRADFYAGKTRDAEWLGSTAWDGYPNGIPDAIKSATTLEDFRAAVAAHFAERQDVTLPEQGWPWPWDDSGTTDYAYAHDGEHTYGSCFGRPWFRADAPEPEDDEDEGGDVPDFPDMSTRKNVVFDGPASGLFAIRAAPGGLSVR